MHFLRFLPISVLLMTAVASPTRDVRQPPHLLERRKTNCGQYAPTNGGYYYIQNLEAGTFLMIDGGDHHGRAMAGTQALPSSRSSMQLWRVYLWDVDGDMCVWRLKNQASDTFLDLDDASDDNGKGLHAWESSDIGSQDWEITYDEKAAKLKGMKIINHRVHKCVEVEDGDPTPGKQVQTWDCKDMDRFRWRFLHVGDLELGEP